MREFLFGLTVFLCVQIYQLPHIDRACRFPHLMVYVKTFTTFARHAFQKAAFAGHAHASPSGAAHASSFFNQSFAGAGRSQLGPGAIANRFHSQFGAHAGKNNPNPSQGNTQTSIYGQAMVAATANDDGREELHHRRQPQYQAPNLATPLTLDHILLLPLNKTSLPTKCCMNLKPPTWIFTRNQTSRPPLQITSYRL